MKSEGKRTQDRVNSNEARYLFSFKKKKFRVDATKLSTGRRGGLQYSKSYAWIKESPVHESPCKPC